jgi:hypothetical protein
MHSIIWFWLSLCFWDAITFDKNLLAGFFFLVEQWAEC